MPKHPLILLLLVIFFVPLASMYADECSPASCGRKEPQVRFPFRLKGHHPLHCGYQGFDLSCTSNNETLLSFSFIVKTSKHTTSLEFKVKQIDYKHQSIAISGTDDCFPEISSNLDMLPSPYKSSDYWLNTLLDGWTLINCSSEKIFDYIFSGYHDIPCPTHSGYHVYAVYSEEALFDSNLVSCTKIFNISYTPGWLFHFPSQLHWSEPDCRDCEAEGKYCRLMNDTTKKETECFQGKRHRGVSRRIIIAGAVGGLLLLCLAFVAFRYVLGLIRRTEDQERIDKFLEDYRALRPARYSYSDIKKITDDFGEKLGQGGYGTVYKGRLSNDVLVAVKVLNNFKGIDNDFINEAGTIGKIHHVNVVRLVGYCADGCRGALVYEFLPNGSLDRVISSKREGRSLGWRKLEQIALGIAKGIDYLHRGCDQRILHFDIKPQNILLDQNFNPKVSDFGLAKLCSKDQSMVSMTAARGTIGYIAPEVFSRNFGKVSHKSDIYSFGMLLLDIVGARNRFDARGNDSSEAYFPEWMYNQLDKGEEIAIDIENEEDGKTLKKLSIVGLWCIQWHPADRPSMELAIQMLEGEDAPVMPSNPFASSNINTTTSVVRGSLFNSELESIPETSTSTIIE